MLNYRNFLISFLLGLQLLSADAAFANNDQNVMLREFLSSLSAAERKLPLGLVVQARVVAGEAVPRALRAEGANARSLGVGSEILVKINGEDTAELVNTLRAIGAEPKFVSSSRPYVTASLTEDQLWDLSVFDGVRSIRYVSGPLAQGVIEQAAAEPIAVAAHRTSSFTNVANATEQLDGTLQGNGEGVVIGLISLPVEQADVALLDAESPRLIPAFSPASASDQRLYYLNGAFGSAAESSADALNMLQLIYDIAPKATVVLASPGKTSTPGEMAAVINSLVAGVTESGTPGEEGFVPYAPPVNIIVDDLLYPSQNPFEVGEVSEAMAAATSAGVLHISSAGDGGNDSNSTASVYFDFFESVAASEISGFVDKPKSGEEAFYLGFEQIHKFGGAGFLTVKQKLSDICLFWAADPDAEGSQLTATIFGADNQFKAWWIVDGKAPGGCLSDEMPDAVTSLAVNDYIVLENFGLSDPEYFGVIGYRDAPDLTNLQKTFDLTTPGGILGHAYSPNTVTVAGNPLSGCYDPETLAVTPFKTCTADVTIESFSADGHPDGVRRFHWESDGGGYRAETIDPDPKKPDVSMLGFGNVKTITSSAVDTGTSVYRGTSASAAHAAGVAALYWEYREKQITEDPKISGPVDPSHVAVALRASAINPARPAAGAAEPAAVWDNNFGQGIVDAPRAIEGPTPALDVTLTPSAGAATIDFKLALNDIAESFDYELACDSGYAARKVEASNATILGSGLEKAPIRVTGPLSAALTCTVTTSKAGTSLTGVATVSTTTLDLAAPTFTLVAGAGGATLTTAASSSAASGGGVYTYTANCTAAGSAVTLVGGNTLTVGTPAAVPAVAGQEIACTVTVKVDSHSKTSAEKKATAQAVTGSTITLSEDAGGFLVTIARDSALVSSELVPVTLTCQQGGQVMTNVDGLVITDDEVFIEADDAEVTCSATSVLTVDGSAVPVTFAGGATTVEPGPSQTGLPVWLLYISTQPAATP